MSKLGCPCACNGIGIATRLGSFATVSLQRTVARRGFPMGLTRLPTFAAATCPKYVRLS